MSKNAKLVVFLAVKGGLVSEGSLATGRVNNWAAFLAPKKGYNEKTN